MGLYEFSEMLASQRRRPDKFIYTIVKTRWHSLDSEKFLFRVKNSMEFFIDHSEGPITSNSSLKESRTGNKQTKNDKSLRISFFLKLPERTSCRPRGLLSRHDFGKWDRPLRSQSLPFLISSPPFSVTKSRWRVLCPNNSVESLCPLTSLCLWECVSRYMCYCA